MVDHSLSVQVQMDAEEVVAGLQQINDSLSNLPGSMEINFSVDDTATETITSIKEELEALPDEANITITAEDAATDTLTEISSSLEELPVEARITVTIFDDFVTETLNSIQDRIDNLPDEVKLTITAEDAATDTLERISESIEDATYTITIRADDEATDVINNVKEALEDLPGEYTVKIVADDEATGVVDDVKEALSSIPDEVRSVIDVDAGDSLKVIDDVADRLEEIDGTDATASVSVEGTEEAVQSTDIFNLSMSGLGKTVTAVGGSIGSYEILLKSLDYHKAIRLAQMYTEATDDQRRAMEKLVQENMSVKLGMAGTAQVMTLLARYTGDANEAMGYFKAVMDAIKVTGEDSTTVTLTLMNTFREFGVSMDESYHSMARLIQLWNVSGFPSFTGFLSVVDRLGLTLGQIGFTLEDTASIVAAVGPQGALILRSFASQLYKLNSEWERGTPEAREYAKKLEKFGIVTRDASGHLRSLRDVIFDFIEYLQKLPDHETRVKVATEVFGDSMGKALVAVAENYGKVEKASRKSADQQIKDAKKINAEALPPLQRFMKHVEQIVPAIEGIAPTIASLIEHLAYLAVIDEWVLKGLIRNTLFRIGETLKNAISRLIPSSVKDAVKDASRRIKDIIKDTLKGLADDAARLISDALKRVAESIRARTPSLTSAVKDALSRARDALKRFLGEEGGRINLSFVVEEWGADDAARGFLSRFSSSLDDAARVSIPSLGSRIGSLLVRGIGEGVGAALMTVDILANFRQYLSDALTDPTKLFGPISYTIPEPLKKLLSPENLFKTLYGPEEWEKRKGILMDNAKKYVEDPIREQLREFAENPPGYLIQGFSQMWNDFKSWVSSHIPKFRWPRLPSLSIPNPVTAIQSAWAKFRSWVSSNIPRFRWPRLPNITIPNIVGAVQLAWSKFKSWVSSNIPRFRWPRLPNLSMPDILGAFRRTWSTFTSKVRGVFSGFKWPRLPLPNFSGIASSFRAWGARFIHNLVEGIRSALPNLNNILAKIRRLLPSSPPKEGPLSSLTYDVMKEYGYLLGHSFSEGLSATIPSVIDGLGRAPSPPSLYIPTGGVGAIHSLQPRVEVHTHVNVDTVRSEVDVERMADKITRKVAEQMDEEMLRQGIPGFLYGNRYVTALR